MRGIVILGLSVMLGLVVGCGGGNSANVSSAPMPEGGNWSGVYYSPQYGEMHLVQNGSAVAGRFKKDERSGDIQGEAEGNLLEFGWVEYKAMVSNRPQETKGRGYFQYMVDPNSGDHVLKGRWGMGDSDTNGGEWNAYRARNKEPDPDSLRDKTSGGESTDLDSDDSSSDSDDSSSDDSSGGEGESDDEIF